MNGYVNWTNRSDVRMILKLDSPIQFGQRPVEEGPLALALHNVGKRRADDVRLEFRSGKHIWASESAASLGPDERLEKVISPETVNGFTDVRVTWRNAGQLSRRAHERFIVDRPMGKEFPFVTRRLAERQMPKITLA